MTNKNHYISASRVCMTTKLSKMVTYLDGLLRLKSHDHLVTWSCEINWQTKSIISSMPHDMNMTMKLGKRVTYHEGLSPIK